ncbi:hypothetical protein [Aquimarina longa]|uniref:hypothetical protein n=1 Tax=Aquimarina longa TaxID=1080221 RepID=UPI0007857225|nr:hypothetical protein [Aquimarina longa]
MITHQEKTIQNVIKLFDGMYKYEVYDILQKIEELLLNFASPIQFKEIKQAIETRFKKEPITAVDSYGYCYLDDECQYMKIYKIKSCFPIFLGGESTYFTTTIHQELTPYTTDDLQEAFMGTHLEIVLQHFLKHTNPKNRNPKTKRLLLLEYLDQIDPENIPTLK